MAKIIGRTRVVTNTVRASYVHVAQPASVNGSDPKYSMSIILPKEDKETMQLIEQAIDHAIEDGIAKFGGKKPKKSMLKLPVRDGDTDRDDEAYANSFFINCNSKTAPQVVGPDRRPIDPEEVFSGCYVRVSINFYAFNTNGNKGVACGLGNVQFVKEGESLGGSHISAAADFGEPDEEEDFLL